MALDVREKRKPVASKWAIGRKHFTSSSLLLSSLELSDTKVYEPYIRDLLGTAAHFCKVGRKDLAGILFEDRAEAVRLEPQLPVQLHLFFFFFFFITLEPRVE